MTVELRTLIEDHSHHLKEIGEGVMNKNSDAVVKGLVGLAVSVGTSTPLLGALSSEAVAKIFANTATKRLEAAVRAAKLDDAKKSFVDDISAAIEALLGEFLVQLVRVQHATKDDLVLALGGQSQLEGFGKQVAAQLKDIAVHVDRMDVRGGALGIHVSEAGRSAFVRIMNVDGPGSVAIKL